MWYGGSGGRLVGGAGGLCVGGLLLVDDVEV